MKHPFYISLLIFILASCNGGGGSGSTTKVIPTKKKEENKLETEMYGIYQAILTPVNKTITPKVTGSFTLMREREFLVADLRLSNGPASILHVQNLHVGTRCPTSADDLNADGVIDGEEGARVYKEIIIPLDEDLNSQRMGGGTYPLADKYGHYSYSRVADWNKFMEDLWEEDINPTDDYVKLEPNKAMTAIGKVVVVLGVTADTELPPTVAGRGRLTQHEALPIACGVLKKLDKSPGKIDDDHTGIPYLGGESIGGSGGGDDGADFSSTTTMGSTSGNYGEDD